jgi:hypothetical protein
MGASEVEETGLSGTVEELRVLATHVEQASQLFKLDHVRAAVIVDGLAELHVRWPAVPIVFCETRRLAEEWTYRYLAAAQAGAITEHPALQHISPGNRSSGVPAVPEPGTGEVRACARGIGLAVPDRGRVGPEIRQAWRDAHRIT